MDTSNILFICGGTFVGIDKIIGKRLGKRTIGFGQSGDLKGDAGLAELLPQVDSDDILGIWADSGACMGVAVICR